MTNPFIPSGGFQRGELSIIAAKSGVGRSTYMTRSIETRWSKTGKTARAVPALIVPSKFEVTVPEGTAVRFIGRWVVADLTWLALQEGERVQSLMKIRGETLELAGMNTIAYHDADHHGIDIDAADVTDIRDVVR